MHHGLLDPGHTAGCDEFAHAYFRLTPTTAVEPKRRGKRWKNRKGMIAGLRNAGLT